MYGFRKAGPGLTAGVVLASCALLLSSASVPAAPEDPKPVRIGILAKRGLERCREKWGPTADYLTAEIPGYRFVIRPLRHDEVVPAVERAEVDFILANPSLYIELEQLYGASRIVTLNNLRPGGAYTEYAGVIFSKAGRKDIEHLSDLNGKTFMGVEEQSFGGWQMAWRELKEQGINPYRDFSDLQFGGTHDAVVYAVRGGEVDAGTVRTDTLERMAMEGKIDLEEFRVIHEHGGGKVHLPFLHSTRAYPEWPLAKTRQTSDELARKVAIALMETSPENPAATGAGCAGWVIPQNYQPVHECLKELRIGPYKDYGKMTLGAVVRRYWPWLAGAVAILVLACVVSAYVMRLNRALRHALSAHQQELADRKRAEEALRESEERFTTFMDYLPAAVFIKDAQSRNLYLNRYMNEVFGARDWIGRSSEELFPEEIARAMVDDDKRVLREGHLVREEAVPDKHGVEHVYQTHKFSMDQKGGGKLLGGFALDITERRRAEENLRRSEATRAEAEKLAATGRLAAGVAHEINNPLTGVLTFAHLLREKENMDEQDKQDLDLIIGETTRASEIVHGLLDFARECPPLKEPLDVNDMVRRTLRLLGNQKAFRRITVEEEFGEGLPKVNGDMNQLQQVVLNLCLNASSAMPEGGTLRITTSAQSGDVLLKLDDTGCGIKQEHLDRIFEPFFSTKPVGKGTGLGLSVSYGIVQQHGGSLEVESTEGKGATFTVVLPAADNKQGDGPQQEADQ